jgi:hypothetical protein
MIKKGFQASKAQKSWAFCTIKSWTSTMFLLFFAPKRKMSTCRPGPVVQDPVAKPNMRGPSKRGAGAFFDSKVTQVRRRKIARMKGVPYMEYPLVN